LFVQWRGDAWRALAATPFYRQTLIGPAPSAMRLKLNERWPGDSAARQCGPGRQHRILPAS
jgi:hypothetical protein